MGWIFTDEFEYVAPGIVNYRDTGHDADQRAKVERELLPLLVPFLDKPLNSETVGTMRDVVDSYFSKQWAAHVGHNTVVDIDPFGGVMLTTYINYNVDHTVDFAVSEIDIEEALDEFFESVLLDGDLIEAIELIADTDKEKDKETQSPDDILFEPIVLEEDKPKPVVQDDYYDGCGYL